MKHKIIIWDEKKYGIYNIYDTLNFYLKNKDSITYDMEIDNIGNLFTEYSCIIINNKLYRTFNNIIDTDRNENIIFVCYELKEDTY